MGLLGKKSPPPPKEGQQPTSLLGVVAKEEKLRRLKEERHNLSVGTTLISNVHSKADEIKQNLTQLGQLDAEIGRLSSESKE